MNITQDLVDEILSRLPVKSLIRFKVVCKDWYSNIESHSFKAKHRKNQTTKKQLLYYHHRSYNINYAVSTCSETEEEVDDDDGLTLFHQSDDQQYFIRDMPSNLLDCRVEIIGTCNGLVCLYHRKRFQTLKDHNMVTVWNPATRDFKTLPPFHVHPLPRGARIICDRVGFGFDVANNDYKVIRIMHFPQSTYFGMREKRTIDIKIYSLSTNNWRKFDCSGLSTDIVIFPESNGTMMGEDIWCWLAKDSTGELVLSFDMGKEVFQKTQLPSDYVDLVKLCRSVTELFNLHDSIALVHYEAEATEKTFSIWSIKELEQGRSSWIKMANVGPFSGIRRPLGFWKCKK